jgi:hypothetical protein
MKRFGKYAIGALMLAGSTLGVTLATTAPADAHVSVGIGIGVPGPGYGYGPAYGNPCADPHYRYYHPEYCGEPGYYAGYYDEGFYGPGYYSPAVGGFWFTDSWGHRRWHGGHGGWGGHGFHGGSWHSGGGHWHHH